MPAGPNAVQDEYYEFIDFVDRLLRAGWLNGLEESLPQEIPTFLAPLCVVDSNKGGVPGAGDLVVRSGTHRFDIQAVVPVNEGVFAAQELHDGGGRGLVVEV